MNSVALISTSLAKSARETVVVRKQCISYMFYVVVYSLILKVQELYWLSCITGKGNTAWVALNNARVYWGLGLEVVGLY